MKKRNFLVTGGTGFIGSALVRRLVTRSHGVRVLDNDVRGNRSRVSDLLDRIEVINGDVRDIEAVTAAARGVDCLVHLAAINGTANFYSRPELVLDVGIMGMYASLQAARRCGVRNFVLASSSEVYQEAAEVPTGEAVPLVVPDPWNPRYSYGGSKLISEIMLANYHADFFERVVIVRPHNVYGPDMGVDHVLPQFILRAHKLIATYPEGVVPFPIQGDGQQTRSFLHIDDFIDGLMLVIEKGVHRNTYHIGSSEELKIVDVAHIVFGWFNRNCEIISYPDKLPRGGTRRRCPNIEKMSIFGFAPKITLKEGMGSIGSWYVSNAAHLTPDNAM